MRRNRSPQPTIPGSDFYKSILDKINEGVYFVDRHRRITYWNEGAERITGYQRHEVIGKYCYADILRHVDEAGTPLCHIACPLAKTISDGLEREDRFYLHNHDGHRQPVRVRTAPFYNSQGQITGAIESFDDDSELTAARTRLKELQKLSLLDAATGIGNRRYLDMNVQTRLDELCRYSWPFGLILLDIDNLKHINDTYGHTFGDRVLKAVATTIHECSRSSDVCGRWGGDEFLVLMVNATPEGLRDMSERFRMLVTRLQLVANDVPVAVSLSVGAAVVTTNTTADAVFAQADSALYQSKINGRNRVTLALDPATPGNHEHLNPAAEAGNHTWPLHAAPVPALY